MTATFVGMPAFPTAARTALADTQLRANLARATGTIRAISVKAGATVPIGRTVAYIYADGEAETPPPAARVYEIRVYDEA